MNFMLGKVFVTDEDLWRIEGMAAHSSILAWRISWTEEPSELQSMGSQRVGYNRSHQVHVHVHTHA